MINIYKYLQETTVSGSYPDIGGLAGDDDYPTGNIIMGMAYKKEVQKLPGGNIVRYKPLEHFMWKDFDSCIGQDVRNSYSPTLNRINNLIGRDLFKQMTLKSKDDKKTVKARQEKGSSNPEDINK